MGNVLTEDQVRDKARVILRFADTENAQSDIGQLRTFNQLGFPGILDKPDGWYLPNETSQPAIILETKNSSTRFSSKHREELMKNVDIAMSRYGKVIGILYNGYEVEVYKNRELIEDERELRNKEYYLGLFSKNSIDKGLIYSLTKSINDSLHIDFGIHNLYHRMIFTACALVAKRYGAMLFHDMSFDLFSGSICDKLKSSLGDDLSRNIKLQTLLEVYSEIKLNKSCRPEAINGFIDDITEISENINSDYWNGEDVMAIFFNEFNRYKKKPESGQVFTPDHITSLMYRISETKGNDRVLDAACGSGAFLVKAMCNMISEAGGIHTTKADEIARTQLFGIENHREIYALACANMLIHKDGKTNLVDLDSRTPSAGQWISEKGITRVLMNPPFENKFGCLEIVENVLDHVGDRAVCAFILPDNKLIKNATKTKRILANHRLDKIIKLPQDLFPGVETSIFMFTAGIKGSPEDKIFTCHIVDDGLETVKNQGRQDVRNRWSEIEDYWVDVILHRRDDASVKWISRSVGDKLCYKMPENALELSSSDFQKTVMDFLLFENGVDEIEFKSYLSDLLLYGSRSKEETLLVKSFVGGSRKSIDTSEWNHELKVSDVFGRPSRPAARSKSKYESGSVPFVSSKNRHNGVECYVAPIGGEALDPGGCITLSPVDGSAFYQPHDFLGRGGAGSSIIMLNPKRRINRHQALFICTVLKAVCSKFKFKDMANSNSIPNERLPLPVAGSGEIDWRGMGEYMRVIERRLLRSISAYKAISKN